MLPTLSPYSKGGEGFSLMKRLLMKSMDVKSPED